ncbi:putative proteasome subunit alpha type-5 [Astathelohania contejeani]|uniref:Proteasome subunit alpha type-5 n=1 Tax=Astathelohania contejeani TaxID=164912 RepID=A0ABQ7HVQ9_9MICR|nr:putative proteasome subunit alpha type-5 [Thelohania contejeani]
MSSTKEDVNTYSPDGRIYQIEYAMKAMNLGTTTLAICTEDSIIICSERKLVSKLQVETVRKHHRIYDHIALAFSGISGDARTITKKAREYCLNHLLLYGQPAPIEGLLRHLSRLSLKFGEKDDNKRIFSRPFGASILLASYEDGPKLYMLDPSGSYRRYKAKAIGSAHEAVENQFSRIKDVKSGLSILGEVMKDKISKENVEVAIINKNGVKICSENEIEEFLNL